MTPPVIAAHSSPPPTDVSPTAVVDAASQDIASTVTLSRPLEGSEQQDSDIVSSSAEPDTSQFFSTTSTPAPAPTLAPIPTSLPNTPSELYDADVTSVSNSLHFAPPSIVSSIPASCPTDGATFPRLRARGLVNTRNICFANAVLQLLVNSPPFWNLFRELGNLEGQREAGVPETGGGATPLVDTTVRFFKEFIVEGESPSTQQQSQPAACGTSRVDEEKKYDNVVDAFEPTYLYDAMKEKRQLKPLLVCSRALLAISCY
jgi:Ubiquitin carboxyl-terminal hydrolase